MLKRLLLVFLSLSGPLCLVAQQKVFQPDLKAEYEVPADWKVTQYYKGGFDKPGGSGICHCALSVNIYHIPSIGDEFDYLHMVVYPSDRKGFTDPMRSQVWQYKISHGDMGDSVKTPNLQWKHFTGKITTAGENRFKDQLVWVYQTNYKEKIYYTVYFWAKAALLSQNKAVIEKIIKGFKCTDAKPKG